MQARKLFQPSFKSQHKWNDMIIYVESWKELTKKLLELTDNYRKVTGYKVNIQKLITFPNTSNEQV